MTQEEKQLLINDLCARLPHYTMVLMGDGGVELLVSVNVDTGICNGLKGLPKPYLRPMSSMTEEEEESLREDTGLDIFKCTVNKELEDLWATDCSVKDLFCLCSWLNEHHFDYNGLIKKGLALEAPEGMYKME